MKLGAANDDPTRTSKNTWITDCVVVPGHNRKRCNSELDEIMRNSQYSTVKKDFHIYWRSRYYDLRFDITRIILSNWWIKFGASPCQPLR